MTRVISVRGRKRDELLADPDFLYVGRAVRFIHWTQSLWGNPFIGPHAVANYEAWIKSMIANEPERFDIRALRGKTLGCWCTTWSPGEPITTPCHAIVLAQLAEEIAR